MLMWRDIKKEKPNDGQECLVKMKHGLLSGYFCAANGDLVEPRQATFCTYMWQDLEFFGTEWVPIEEAVGPSC